MAGQIFEYAVLFHPKSRKVGDEAVTDPSRIIVDLKRVVANRQEDAAIIAARDIPKEFETQLEQIQIVVRPF